MLLPNQLFEHRCRVLRHLKAIVAWHTAVGTLCSAENSQFIRGKLTLGLLDVPHCGYEIATLDDIYEEYFKRYDSDSEAHKAVVKSFMKTYLPLSFPGTIHAEATFSRISRLLPVTMLLTTSLFLMIMSWLCVTCSNRQVL
ncbi:uncharacterized protein F5147DRAFT_311573 [Suillus discolor]|uniref:Uncharacterized protein n=1 Tax=Suillus discolor TaxID=1912936 RepID=A0A9P7F1U0_9AGAM|nr:uncharacterized protein F5147DRAFT_311573 [Suillus discolor]KAG2101579.1 hypothetical protein F5147DRAFT_311573 [Suillus discolor]